MKELYTTPVVEMEMFEAVDVIRTSGEQETTNANYNEPIVGPRDN